MEEISPANTPILNFGVIRLIVAVPAFKSRFRFSFIAEASIFWSRLFFAASNATVSFFAADSAIFTKSVLPPLIYLNMEGNFSLANNAKLSEILVDVKRLSELISVLSCVLIAVDTLSNCFAVKILSSFHWLFWSSNISPLAIL